jgi:signal transduction histidine kinase
VDSFWRLRDLTCGGYRANSDDTWHVLARAQHDCIAQTVTRMLVNLENFELARFGTQSVLAEIADMQESREVLKDLRQVVSNLRSQTGVAEGT